MLNIVPDVWCNRPICVGTCRRRLDIITSSRRSAGDVYYCKLELPDPIHCQCRHRYSKLTQFRVSMV